MNQNNIYLVMNKPCGYVCSSVSDSHKTVYELLEPSLQELVRGVKRGKRLHTVGRLDCDTSGLLLFTTDGYFSDRLTRPESHLSKTYRVTLKNPVNKENQLEYEKQFASGVILPAEKKSPEQKSKSAEIVFLSPFECELTICEGKFHQVKRMFLAVGNEVEALKRTAIAGFILETSLSEGEYRNLSAPEIELLSAEK